MARGVRLAVITWAVTFVLGVVGSPTAFARTFKVLYSFTGVNDGGLPTGPFAIDAKGNLYGAADWSQSGTAGGTIWELSPAGELSVLHAFTGGGNGDGANDSSGVIRDASGNLYGTTWEGGFNQQGVVFEVSASGSESVLYRFTGGSDGLSPTAGLVHDSAGNLYGTTGAEDSCIPCGTVFMVDPTGKETQLYAFKGPPDASHVLFGNLVLDAKGNLYGVSYYGGLTGGCFAPQNGCGTVFKLSPNGNGGWSEKVLYKFKGGKDGAYPFSGLIRDGKGNFYGTTAWGGNTDCGEGGCGTVFKLDKTGKETVLYRFTGGKDGAEPGNVLVIDKKGNLYGTTMNGGGTDCLYGCGTVFEVSAKGRFSVLHAFHKTDGAWPGALLLDAAGNLYGGAAGGGASSWGTLFEITP
jgi:uncharacterized repeat protein (TIGR03803 family)